MSFPQLSISFDSENNFFELSHDNFKNSVKCFNYINFKIYIVGRPIIENKIDYNKTLKILEELADNNFSKYTNLQKINGEFLFILNNQSNNQLIIINDRFCSIPLFYCNYKNKLSISTNYFEIIKFLKKNNIFQFDSFSAFEFLQFKKIHGNNSYDLNSLFLESASILFFKEKSFNKNKYLEWKIDNNRKTLNENSLQLISLLKNAISRKINSPLEDYCIFLSGGMDTRFLTACLNEIDTSHKLKYFTLGWSKQGEYEITEKICKLIKSENIFIKIPADYYENLNHEKLMISNGMYNMYPNIFLNIPSELLYNSKIAFHGHGLDYMFQGMYIPSKNLKLFGKSTLIKRILKLNYESLINTYINNISYRVKNPYYNFIIKKVNKIDLMNRLNFKLSELVAESRNFTDNPYKSWEYLINHNLSRHYSYTDVMGIGSNIEQRKIANDNDLYNFYLSLPIKDRFNAKIIKKSLLLINKDLANIESANTRYKITASNLEITFNYILKKIIFQLTKNERYKFPSGKKRTWPDEAGVLKESEYFIGRINNLYKSDYLREYINFIDYENLKKFNELFLLNNNMHGYSQFIFVLLTIENFLKEI